MTHEEIKNGLKQLGFEGGWVVTGEEITLWENDEPKPSNKEILDAAKVYQATLETLEAQKTLDREALLTRLGITAEEAKLLLG
jgi:hypothetical protein